MTSLTDNNTFRITRLAGKITVSGSEVKNRYAGSPDANMNYEFSLKNGDAEFFFENQDFLSCALSELIPTNQYSITIRGIEFTLPRGMTGEWYVNDLRNCLELYEAFFTTDG